MHMNSKKEVITKVAVGGVGALAAVVGVTTVTQALETTATPVVVTQDKEQVVACENSDVFTQDESGVLAAEYQKTAGADCFFVSCGGVI